MKINSGVLGVISSLVLFVAFAYAQQGGGQQGSMPDQRSRSGAQQQMNQHAALSQDPQTVRQVQQALSAQGFDPGPADGKWKTKTESALMLFQEAQGMQATGQLDQQTLASLGVSGAAAGGQQGDMTDQQGAMPDQSGAGGRQGGMQNQQNQQGGKY